MATMQRVIPQEELDAGFGLLKSIIQIVNDPKGAEAAYQAVRDKAKLTDEELAAAAAARKAIQDADALTKTFDAREEALKNDRAQLTADIEKFNNEATAKSNQLESFSNELNARATETDNGRQKLVDDQAAFAADIGKEKQALTDRENQLGEKAAAVQKDAGANTAEANRLAEVSKALETRAKKIGLLEQAAEL